MATDVIMPQMGESIAEGTITKWIKNVGDTVERDEPLFEISTDKVDAEIPSPAAGVLLEIRVQQGETVAVNTVVGASARPERRPRGSGPRRPGGAADDRLRRTAQSPAPAAPKPAANLEAPTPAAPTAALPAAPAPRGRGRSPARRAGAASVEERLRRSSSPLVRSIAAENESRPSARWKAPVSRAG